MTQRDPNFVTVREVEFTALCHAIERARWRMAPLRGIELVEAAVIEMQHIIRAKDAYDDAVARAQAEKIIDLVFPSGVLMK